MTRYLISFDDGAMTFPEEELKDTLDLPTLTDYMVSIGRRPPTDVYR